MHADKLCLALDEPQSLEAAKALLRDMMGLVGVVKLNSAFVEYHLAIIMYAHDLGFRVWIDSKCHDVPRTVSALIRRYRGLGADFVTIHLSGGSKMISAAVEAAREKREDGQPPIIIIGVSVLTSVSDEILNEELRIPGTVEQHVVHLATLGHRCGVQHIVCSAMESRVILSALLGEVYTITPGIRFAQSDTGTHAPCRVTTPGVAVAHFGASMIVMGTELVQGGRAAAVRALAEIEEALAV